MSTTLLSSLQQQQKKTQWTSVWYRTFSWLLPTSLWSVIKILSTCSTLQASENNFIAATAWLWMVTVNEFQVWCYLCNLTPEPFLFIPVKAVALSVVTIKMLFLLEKSFTLLLRIYLLRYIFPLIAYLKQQFCKAVKNFFLKQFSLMLQA